MSHSPGPWKTCGFENLTVNDSEGNTILACPGSSTGTLLEMKGNAALIAAAPELLAALKAVDRALGHKFDSDLADIVDATLAKAEGEE